MTTSKNKAQLANLNRLGEQLRMSGEFTGAIKQFDEVLKEEPGNAWTLAHRGAAKLSMGQLTTPLRSKNGPGAIEDLEAALKLRANYPWAQSRLGEAYRSLARNQFPEFMKEGRYTELLALTHKAEGYFTQVLTLDDQEDNTWALAHRGATRALTFVVMVHQGAPPSRSRKQSYDVLAEEDLKQAIALNPSYAWALATYGFLLTLKKRYAQAGEVANRAAAADTQQRLHIARTMCQLSYYDGQLDEAVNRGWEAMRANPEDFVARYFLAASMMRQERSAVSRAFMESTRKELLEVRSVVDYLLASTHMHLGANVEPAFEHPVPETVGLYQLDPVWKGSRAKKKSASKQRSR